MKKLTDIELKKRFDDIVGPEYTFVSRIENSKSNCIKCLVIHNDKDCFHNGKPFEIKYYNWVSNGQRCKCKPKSEISEIYKIRPNLKEEYSISNFKGMHKPLTLTHNICGTTYTISRAEFLKYGKTGGCCPNCSNPYATSNMEDDIIKIIQKYDKNITIIKNSHVLGQEIDIYLPEYQLGIEFNGAFWHSTAHKDCFYHLNKSIMFAYNDIGIFHIFEDEYIDNKTLIEHLLLSTISSDKIINIDDVSVCSIDNFADYFRKSLISHKFIKYSTFLLKTNEVPILAIMVNSTKKKAIIQNIYGNFANNLNIAIQLLHLNNCDYLIDISTTNVCKNSLPKDFIIWNIKSPNKLISNIRSKNDKYYYYDCGFMWLKNKPHKK